MTMMVIFALKLQTIADELQKIRVVCIFAAPCIRLMKQFRLKVVLDRWDSGNVLQLLRDTVPSRHQTYDYLSSQI